MFQGFRVKSKNETVAAGTLGSVPVFSWGLSPRILLGSVPVFSENVPSVPGFLSPVSPLVDI